MSDLPTKALSIRQPWAWAILHAGKDIENRDWRTTYRGPVLIHASKTMTYAELDGEDTIRTVLGRRGEPVGTVIEGMLYRGGIVGVAEIVDCVAESDSPWFFGRWGFVLRNVRPLPFRPCRGALGFFTPDPTIDLAPATKPDLFTGATP